MLSSLSQTTMTLLVNRCSLVDRLNKKCRQSASVARSHISIACIYCKAVQNGLQVQVSISSVAERLRWMERYKNIRRVMILTGDVGSLTVILSGIPRLIRCRIDTLAIPRIADPNGDWPVLNVILSLAVRVRRIVVDSLTRTNPYSPDDLLDLMDISPAQSTVSSRLDSFDPIIKIASVKLDSNTVSSSRLNVLSIHGDCQGEVVVNCPALVELKSVVPITHLFCPNLLLLEICELPDSIVSIQLPNLSRLSVGKANSSILYELKNISPSLKYLRITELTDECLITANFPSSLTTLSIYSVGAQQARIVFDGSLRLKRLIMRCRGMVGTLPDSLHMLQVKELALCEIAHCRHLRILSYTSITDETEWPNTLTELRVSINKQYKLPQVLPSNLKVFIIASTLDIRFSWSIHTLNILEAPVELTPEQISQFRGYGIKCNNRKQELEALQTKNQRRILIHCRA